MGPRADHGFRDIREKWAGQLLPGRSDYRRCDESRQPGIPGYSPRVRQCHHHPFEHWGQDDFYGLAGFFNGIERKPYQGEGEMVVQTGFHEMAIPRTSRIVPTHPPGGPVLDGKLDTDPRRQLADWMTKPGNPWFARLVVNRLWKHYLGRGLVEPEDDLRSTNPATNEPLLDYLADRLVAYRYRPKSSHATDPQFAHLPAFQCAECNECRR